MKNIWPGSAEAFWIIFIPTHVCMMAAGARFLYIGLAFMGVYFVLCTRYIYWDHLREHSWKWTAIRTLVMIGFNLPWTIPRCLFHS